jgi:hypothetical protein
MVCWCYNRVDANWKLSDLVSVDALNKSRASISISSTPHQLSLSHLTISAPVIAYNIQSTTTSTLVMSVFSLSVSTTILDLTISEFILWIMNLRKQIEIKITIYNN